MKAFTSLVLSFVFCALNCAFSAEKNRVYEVLSIPTLMKNFEEKEAKAKVMAWFQKADPERWAEFSEEDEVAERARYQAMAMDYFLNLKHKEGWELLFIENETLIFKKIVFVPRVRRVPVPKAEPQPQGQRIPVPASE